MRHALSGDQLVWEWRLPNPKAGVGVGWDSGWNQSGLSWTPKGLTTASEPKEGPPTVLDCYKTNAVLTSASGSVCKVCLEQCYSVMFYISFFFSLLCDAFLIFTPIRLESWILIFYFCFVRIEKNGGKFPRCYKGRIDMIWWLIG